jgi:geranylgeranyl pyrophosphate synthase
MSLNEKLKPYTDLISGEIYSLKKFQEVPLFYDPIYYVLDLPGKKIRPLLVMLSCGVAGGSVEKAVFAATAVELLHNFTLVHDDIMDNDETRRGKPSVHVKWDVNTAILCGDGLLGFAFQKLLQSPVENRALLADRFTEAMIIICEGQGLDKMFEHHPEVTDIRYLDMIERKTAALIRLSCELGALVAGVEANVVDKLRDFGHNLGMAFQIQDDILDIMADQQKLGKKVGSDFLMHKQTLLTIKLRQKIGRKRFDALSLEAYKKAIEDEGILEETLKISDDYFKNTFILLDSFKSSDPKKVLWELTSHIRNRGF